MSPTPVLPLSLSKLMLAASWWDNHQPDSNLRLTPHEMLVDGSDSAGRQMALALRASVRTEAVLRDFDRYGFQTLLAAGTKDAEWAHTLSIGETNIRVTALHISRFLQAISNQGMVVSPNTGPAIRRVMQEKTALRLQSAMRDAVQRGTATSIATALAGTGWQMGGKTGSGPGPASSISELDGWFAG
jgi:hypothetical protein